MTSSTRFIMYCEEERQARYEEFAVKNGFKLEIFNTVESLLNSCVGFPPAGLMIDIPSARGTSADIVTTLGNLDLAWPILKCRTSSSGDLTAMCAQPMNRGPLGEALKAILEQDESWLPKNFQRHFIRVPCRLRARVKAYDQDWIRGMILDMGVAGCFFQCIEPLEMGTPIQVEIWDLEETPFEVRGIVKWIRSWEALPGQWAGMGLAFAPDCSEEVSNKLSAGAISFLSKMM